MELEEARAVIRAQDAVIADAFTLRMKAVKAIAEYKRAHGLPVLDPAQEERVLRAGSERIADEELRGYYMEFQRDVMTVSKRYQHRLLEGLRVAYNGVAGAFAHVAVRRIFPDADAVACASFADAYDAVEKGDCDLAVLPIENSYAGEVGQVTDLMFGGRLYISGVYDLRVSQNLLGTPDATLEDLTCVVSHPQALAQCQAYILARGLEQRSASSTSGAARSVAEAGDRTVAAIAGAETAALYGLRILDRDIQDGSGNTTRFAVFSRAETPPPAEGGGTFVLLFTVKNVPGALAKALGVIGEYGFNMKALRSRPMKDLSWSCFFYVEAEGDDASERGQRMIEALRPHCARLKVAGRYGAEILLRDGEPG